MRKILSLVLGLLWTLPAFATLPSGYTQLEYIESTGTQWIDTGVYVNTLTNPTIETSFKMNKKNDIDWFGTQGISQPTILYNFDSNKNMTYIRWGSTASVEFRYETGKSSNYFLFNSNFSKLKIDNNNNQPKYYVNDELIATQTSTPSFRNNQPLLIGRARTPSNSSWKSFKISDNGVDLFYGVPCTRDSDNVAGMYDLVSNQFFTNAGTGEFIAGPVAEIKIATTKYNESAFGPLNTALANAISVVDTVVSNTITQAGRIATLQAQKQTRPNDIADDNEKCPAGKKCLLVEDASGIPHWYEIVTGRLPDGYTELEYIESTGTQYIDTGVKGNMGIKADIDFSVSDVQSTNFILAARKAIGSDTRFYLCTFYTGGESQFDIALGKDSFTHGVVANQRYNYFMDTSVSPATLLVDGSVIITNTNTYNTDLDLYMFANNLGGTASFGGTTPIRIYYAKIYENNTLVRDFVPAKNASGKIGMYDLVGGRFYENAGTGEFIGGQPVFN